jgi:hypothetical protein
MKIAHLSTFPDMRCGIAFYTSDLIDALPQLAHRKYALHYGRNPTPEKRGKRGQVRRHLSVRLLWPPGRAVPNQHETSSGFFSPFRRNVPRRFIQLACL